MHEFIKHWIISLLQKLKNKKNKKKKMDGIKGDWKK